MCFELSSFKRVESSIYPFTRSKMSGLLIKTRKYSLLKLKKRLSTKQKLKLLPSPSLSFLGWFGFTRRSGNFYGWWNGLNWGGINFVLK